MWRSLLLRALTESSGGERPIFDLFLEQFEDHYLNLRSTNMRQLKTARDINRQKGTVFEELCLELIRSEALLDDLSIVEVWRFPDLPEQHMKRLGFVTTRGAINRRDLGIDLVAHTSDGRWCAVQCKYLKRPTKKSYTPSGYPRRWAVKWNDLSTFYGLTARTGPWHKLIIITNSEGVQRGGRGTRTDELLITYTDFSNIPRHLWSAPCGDLGNKLGETPTGGSPPPSEDPPK